VTGRLDRIRRLLAVQGNRGQLSEWRLLELSSQLAILDERYRSLVRFLQEKSAFSGMFSLSVMRRLQRLAEMRAKAASDQEAQRELHLHDRGCLKTAPINVPMISNGTVEGYIVAQFVYLADETSLRELSVPPR
jgi:hypothetical protein